MTVYLHLQELMAMASLMVKTNSAMVVALDIVSQRESLPPGQDSEPGACYKELSLAMWTCPRSWRWLSKSCTTDILQVMN